MIGIIDIGISNFQSVTNSIKRLNLEYTTVKHPDDFTDLTKLIFPGVGSYTSAMQRLKTYELVAPIKRFIESGKPYLGICLGMQLLSKVGFEGVETEGLGVLNASVVRMEPASNEPLPHIGWNQVNHEGQGLFTGIPLDADFYFVHSYYMKLHEDVINYSVNYGGSHTCFIQKKNVFGAQFHPEKSQKFGLKFLENFVNA